MSCSRASVERTISPISISASRLPAIPVLIIALTLNMAESASAATAALTFPIPLLTRTTSCPERVPVQNSIPACFSTLG